MPSYLAADSAYGSAANLAWLVNERDIAPHDQSNTDKIVAANKVQNLQNSYASILHEYSIRIIIL
jgi:hypothetical protein